MGVTSTHHAQGELLSLLLPQQTKKGCYRVPFAHGLSLHMCGGLKVGGQQRQHCTARMPADVARMMAVITLHRNGLQVKLLIKNKVHLHVVRSGVRCTDGPVALACTV